MINRILIRIKVVQILYSYLLSFSEFKIDAAPENASRDRRFAYAVYLDMMMLIQQLSGSRVNNPACVARAIDVNKKLKANRVAKALADNPQLKEITFKELADINTLSPLLQQLHDEICKTSAFADYSKKRSVSLDDDVKFWTTILETTILKNSDLTQALRTNPDFSLTGLHHGVMAAVDTLRAYNDTRFAMQKAINELGQSLDQAYKLYWAMFVLMIEITKEQAERHEIAKGKYLATSEDLNPDTRFVDNKFIAFLEQHPQVQQFIKDEKFTWNDSTGLLKNLLDSILASDLYAEYMQTPAGDWHADCEFWRNVMRNIVIPSDQLGEALEAKSIFWNDDINIIGTFVLKSLRKFSLSDEGQDVEFLPQFKDDEDAEFGLNLFNATVANREEYKAYIDRFINKDWDPDRLAFMDIVIMLVAITEIVNFQSIPLPVSLNEYIEIANNYSTRRSGPFINGILYSVVKTLADEGRLNKPFIHADNRNNSIN